MKRLLASVVSVVAIALCILLYYRDDSPEDSIAGAPAVPQHLEPDAETRDIPREGTLESSIVEHHELDLAFWCARGLETDACLDAADAWMRARKATMSGWPGHSGRTWGEVFDGFAAQVESVERAVGDPECDVAGWRPDLEHQCAAWETHNLALAIRACVQPPDNALHRVQFLDLRGETNLEAIRQARRSEAEEWVQRAWLSRECHHKWVPLKNEITGLVGYADDSPWVDAVFGERAALLGDKAAAKYYVHNKMALDVWRVYGNTIIVDFTDEAAVARARQADLSTRAVVDEIVKRDPATGYDLLGDFEFERMPQVRSRSRYMEHFPHDYWVARAETAAAYKLAALRLQGARSHLPFDELVDRDIDWVAIGELIGEDVYSLLYRVDQISGEPADEDGHWWP